MNLEEWRAARAAGEPGTLPSGLTVVLQKVHIMDLVSQGKIPQQLQPALERQLGHSNNKSQQMTTDELAAYYELTGIVALACIKEPQGLTAEELPAEDKIAVYQWAMEGAQKLQPFRRQEKKLMESA